MEGKSKMASYNLLSNYSDEKLSNIPPSNIIHYIKINGWVKVKDVPFDVDLYRHPKYENEIVVPKNQKHFDYTNDLLEIVKKLSPIENRSPKKIIDDIINNSPSDIIKIGCVSYQDEKGTIPVNDCINLYISIRDSINIIGKDIIDQDPKEKYEISDFLNSCLVGQTEFGSYVTPLICPLLIRENQQTDLSFFEDSQDIENLLTRKITRTFVNSVNHMISCINDDNTEMLLNFDKNDAVDVSSNSSFYRALGTIGLNNIKNMNIDIKWGVKDPSGVPHHLSVERKHFEVLLDIIQTLCEKTIIEQTINTTYMGKIYSVLTSAKNKKSRKNSIKKDDDGKFGFSFLAEDDKSYYVHFNLRGKDYENACDAIKNHLMVNVEGIFTKKIDGGNIKYSIDNLEKFSIVTKQTIYNYDNHQVRQKPLIDTDFNVSK